MKIKIFIVAVLVGLVSVGGANAPAVSPISLCDDSNATTVRKIEHRSNVEIYRAEICRVGGVISYTDWVDGIQNIHRTATAYEQILFALKSYSDERDVRTSRLRNAAVVLRTWESQAAQTVIDWDGLTPAQKDTRLKILVERSGIFYGHFADLLAVESLD